MPKTIFISHRHADQAIASVFRQHFEDWNVPQGEIFQSSHPQTGPVIGESLMKEIRHALAEARLVLLIYTSAEADWAWCTLECGLAINPLDETPNTRVALFQMSRQEAEIPLAQVVFKLNEDDIAKFVDQFHRHEGFFRKDVAYHPTIGTETLRKRADALYKGLMSVSLPGKTEERIRWDRFTLRLRPDHLRAFVDTKRAGVSADEVAHFLMEHAEMVDAFGHALVHFGYQQGTTGLKLGDLVTRWSEKVAQDGDSRGWIRELCEEMNRSIENRPAEPSWELMRSREHKDWRFFPVLNHARVMPDGTFEFDVYMYRVPGSLQTIAAAVSA